MRKSIKHNKSVGWLIERCRYNRRERALAETWMNENKDSRFGDTLQKIFIIDRDISSLFGKTRKTKITARDRFIVATVIQWLGTNIGWGFLERALLRAGYSIVPLSNSPEREYFEPFDPGNKRNASAWNNLMAKYEYGKLPILPVVQETKQFRKKHLMRHRPGLAGSTICIRCGFLSDSIRRNRMEPPCLWDQKSIDRRREFQDLIDRPDDRPRARIKSSFEPVNGLYFLELDRMLTKEQINQLPGNIMIVNGFARRAWLR